MTKMQEKAYDRLIGLSAEDAVDCLLDYHGTQLLDDGFIEHMEDEGYLESSDEDEEKTITYEY